MKINEPFMAFAKDNLHDHIVFVSKATHFGEPAMSILSETREIFITKRQAAEFFGLNEPQDKS